MRAGIAIRSKEPGAIAVAVAAEMVAARDASRAASDSALQRGAGKVLSVNKRRN
jgi:xanthine/CO dehydrogenase XdhC/CoxF family maturation factor